MADNDVQQTEQDGRNLPVFRSRIRQFLLKGRPEAEQEMLNQIDVQTQMLEHVVREQHSMKGEQQGIKDRQTELRQRMDSVEHKFSPIEAFMKGFQDHAKVKKRIFYVVMTILLLPAIGLFGATILAEWLKHIWHW